MKTFKSFKKKNRAELKVFNPKKSNLRSVIQQNLLLGTGKLFSAFHSRTTGHSENWKNHFGFCLWEVENRKFSQSILSDNLREFYYTKKANSRSCKEKRTLWMFNLRFLKRKQAPERAPAFAQNNIFINTFILILMVSNF